MSMPLRILRIVAFSMLCLVSSAQFSTVQASLLTNGSFESPVQAPSTFIDILPGAEPASFAWQVSSGSVDVASLPLSPFVQYSAADGTQVLDLNGNERGAIYQDFATTAGQQYTLTFSYADNPFEGGVSTANVEVLDVASLASLLSDVISHSSSTNGPPAQANYDAYSGTFTATGALTRLSFTSTSGSNSPSGGIALDAIAVNPSVGGPVVPEPASLIIWTALATTAGMIYMRRSAQAGPPR